VSRPAYVAVCGSGTASADELRAAERVGELLAVAGAVVVCGGLGGVMDAAARGCEGAGGTSIGLLPGADRSGASPHLTAAVPTGTGEARNALVVRAADAVIAVGGEFGTLSEIGLALKMDVPVIGLGTWSFRREGLERDPVARAGSPEEAVDLALTAARRLRS
jgi:uncharacterized protein (TIGR00725 family)